MTWRSRLMSPYFAGPKMDIVRPDSEGKSTGYLATTEEEYAIAMSAVLCMERGERDAIAGRARERSEMFSEAAFSEGLRKALAPLFKLK